MFNKQFLRQLSTSAQGGKPYLIQMKNLPYEYGALEPIVSGHLMEFHYGKHHRTYVNNLNKLTEQAAESLATGDTKKYLSLQKNIKFNGGGHLNHEFFWDSLTPVNNGGGVAPEAGSGLGDAINHSFGSFENFKDHFNTHTASVQGSGWGWLCYNDRLKHLEFHTTANQDIVSDIDADLTPLLTIDIWEHAYYLDYKNMRPNFLKEMWKIINWQKVSERYELAHNA
mmetsp:Transcript_25782/g.18258  ORF Transcript_25782/g.18258 Transcript_25782/m.18258 type:complete len:226 (+) Transcript_25782:101-778(+)